MGFLKNIIEAMKVLPERLFAAQSALLRNSREFSVAVSAAPNVRLPVTGQRPFVFFRFAMRRVCSSISDKLPVDRSEINSVATDLASAGTPLPGPCPGRA